MVNYQQLQYLLHSWFDAHGLVAHQTESFNRFLESKLQEIITENSDLTAESDSGVYSRLTFSRVLIRKPAIRECDGSYHRVTPHECRMRGLGYNCAVHVDVLHEMRDGRQAPLVRKLYKEVLLCRIPCMVGSVGCSLRHNDIGECTHDPLGYFIVNGNEKVVIAQEKMRTNYIFVRKTSPKVLTAEIRSLHATKTRSTSTLLIHLSARAGLHGEVLTAILPFVEHAVPVAILFKFMGLDTLEAIIDFVRLHSPQWSAPREALWRRALDHPLLEESRAQLIEWIGKEGTKEATTQKRVRYIEHILCNEFLPHQGLENSDEVQWRKATFLVKAVLKLCEVYQGHQPADDRDDYRLKRIETTGGLFALLFRQLFRQYLKVLQMGIMRSVEQNKPLVIADAINAKKVTNGLKYAVSTGNWGIQKQSSQCGVAQILTRMNYLATISHLRRINTPINREGKLPKPRQLNASHWGILCPVETPEGQACGLVENLAILTRVRLGVDGAAVVALLHRCNMLQRQMRQGLWHVAVNGCIEGFVEDGEALATELRLWRRRMQLPWDCSIAADVAAKCVSVDTDAGCILRPLLVMAELHKLPELIRTTTSAALWATLQAEGVIEFVDKVEERCLKMGVTHREFHPSCILGICAGLIPFLNHNQAPRNIYEAAMTKQAIGTFSTCHSLRVDTVSHVLHMPQRPLVQTAMHALSACPSMPSGINVIVAVMSHTGFNQEDSLIVNRDALQRGLFRSSIYKAFKDEEKGIGSDLERFGIVPTTAVGARKADYSKVSEDGLPDLNTVVENGDVIIGKHMLTSQLGADRKKRTIQVDHSHILSASEPMRVKRVVLTTNKDGARLVRIKCHATRVPEIGDKFSSHHGQKGVIGMILKQTDMPFTIDGIVPDLILNPHALPGRMTVGQLLETLLGKVCCLSGEIGDGTPFNDRDPRDISAALATHGFESRGNEILFNGRTGAPMETTVFIGPVHYQRLRHCVVDKVHARSRGPVQLITRQPVEGRSRGGGLRVGEMERDCMLAHGAASVLMDRLFKQSDQFDCWVCARCGMIAESIADDVTVCVQSRLYCRNCRCEGPENIKMVSIPYSMKLLYQELGGLNLAMRFHLYPQQEADLGL